MSSGRNYEWNTTLKDGRNVLVEATVWGKDYPARGYDPPEYRDVEVQVFAANEYEERMDPLVDLTDELEGTPEMDVLVERALAFDDDATHAAYAADAAYEAAMERKYDERREAALEREARFVDDTDRDTRNWDDCDD